MKFLIDVFSNNKEELISMTQEVEAESVKNKYTTNDKNKIDNNQYKKRHRTRN